MPSVLSLDLPLMRLDVQRVAAAVDQFAQQFADLPKPLVGFLIGGPTNPFRYSRAMAKRLANLARQVSALGGTPYLTNSRRTPEAFMDRVIEGLPDNALVYRWRVGADDNPYSALLGSADGLVVAGDSISMAVEVARLGQPLGILMPGFSPIGQLDRYRRRFTRWLMVDRPALGRWAYRARILGLTRDYDGFYERLIHSGRAVWAGEEFTSSGSGAALEVDRVVERIVGLVSSRRSLAGSASPSAS